MRRGDTTNSLEVSFGNHTGTHFDFPQHFWDKGKTLNDYPADFFFFKSPCLIDIPVETGRLITVADLAAVSINSGADILLIRTGYGQFYEDSRYWNDNPGLDEPAAIFLKNNFPSLRCLGVDFISINAYKYKTEGRQAHRRLLSPPEIIIIEDLDLTPLEAFGAQPYSIIAAPLLVDRADGTPCTVFAEIQDRAAEKTT